MPGSTYRPLEIRSEDGSRSQIEKYKSAAKEGSPFEELVALTGTYTGLRAGAIAHMTGDWLVRHGNTLYIDVPPYQKCTVGSENGRGGDTTKKGVPCYFCEHRDLEERIDKFLPPKHKLPDDGDCWAVKSEAGYKGRKIPVKDEDTEQILMTYFRVHDRVGAQQSVNGAVKRVAKRAGIFEKGGEDEDDWPTTHSLRDTYGTLLAVKRFTRDEIKSAMGHSTIIEADDYIELSGVETEEAFDEKW